MNSDQEIRDRLARLENNELHRDKQLTDMAEKVDALYDIMVGARGAKWFIVALAMIAGFMLGNWQGVRGLFH